MCRTHGLQWGKKIICTSVNICLDALCRVTHLFHPSYKVEVIRICSIIVILCIIPGHDNVQHVGKVSVHDLLESLAFFGY